MIRNKLPKHRSSARAWYILGIGILAVELSGGVAVWHFFLRFPVEARDLIHAGDTAVINKYCQNARKLYEKALELAPRREKKEIRSKLDRAGECVEAEGK
jgi:hypothetical protein